MSVLVIRHGLSEANNRENIGTLAFAGIDSPLMRQGQSQAEDLGYRLSVNYGIQQAEVYVATSELRRTQETAEIAGFRQITPYAILNEVQHGFELPVLKEMIKNRILPPAAATAAELVLVAPPEQAIWITHGLVIAGLCAALGVYQNKTFVPKFCEIRELPIPS